MFRPLDTISGDTVTTVQITEDIQQIVYSSGGGEYPYSTYLTIGGCDYYLGASLDKELLLTKTPLAPVEGNTPVFMWNETRGAAYNCSRFMTLREGKPVFLADIDGLSSFVDLDGDGQSEIISVNPGVLSQTFIYFWGQYYEGIRKISVNDELDAISVYYENEKFIVNNNGEAEKEYVYQTGHFNEIQN